MVDNSRGDDQGRVLSFMYFFLYIFFVTSRRNASYPSRFLFVYIPASRMCRVFLHTPTEGGGPREIHIQVRQITRHVSDVPERGGSYLHCSGPGRCIY